MNDVAAGARPYGLVHRKKTTEPQVDDLRLCRSVDLANQHTNRAVLVHRPDIVIRAVGTRQPVMPDERPRRSHHRVWVGGWRCGWIGVYSAFYRSHPQTPNMVSASAPLNTTILEWGRDPDSVSILMVHRVGGGAAVAPSIAAGILMRARGFACSIATVAFSHCR
ncbi:hypothetical protein [Nocardia sp. NPDC004711]